MISADTHPPTHLCSLCQPPLQVAKALSHAAKFRSAVVNGGSDMGGQREQLERPLDVLVGTPQRVMQHAGGRRVKHCWARCRCWWQPTCVAAGGLLAGQCTALYGRHMRAQWGVAAARRVPRPPRPPS